MCKTLKVLVTTCILQISITYKEKVRYKSYSEHYVKYEKHYIATLTG